MSNFFTFDEGYYYPTTLSLIILVVLAVIAVIVGGVLLAKKSEDAPKSDKKAIQSTKQLVFCALLLALAFVTSYFPIFKMYWGGSVTLFSMLFITYVGYCYGLKTGLLTAFAYSVLQFIQEPYILTPFQVCCDYFFAFTALGLSGLFAKQKNGLLIGYIVACVARGLFHTIGGYLYWMEYMPDTFPKSLSFAYPIIYNYSYIGVEMILTIIVLSIPAVSKALKTVKSKA